MIASLHPVVAAASSAVFLVTVSSCDPQTGQSTLTGTLSVATAPACSVEGDCDMTSLRVTGSNFRPGSRLKVHVPSGQVDGLPGVVVAATVTVGGSGAFVAEHLVQNCAVVDRPGDARASLVLAADDVDSQLRRAFTFVDTGVIVCKPPFAQPSRPACGALPDLCPFLTADSSTRVGVHWDNRDSGYDTFRVRYGALAADRWTETREFGSDVEHVAINNLTTGTTYEFELLACHTFLFASSECTGWVPVGRAATA